MSADGIRRRVFAAAGFGLGWVSSATGFAFQLLFPLVLIGFPVYAFLRFAGFVEWKTPLGNWEVLVMAFVPGYNLTVLLAVLLGP
ncbi:MAG: hypothetical protein ACE5IB_06135 [Candidatus Geothermarchaeales archaeon]